MENLRNEELLKNGEFLEKLAPIQSAEGIVDAFKKEGGDVSVDQADFLLKAVDATAKKGSALSENELANVAGGFDGDDAKGVGAAIGAGAAGIGAGGVGASILALAINHIVRSRMDY